MTKDNVIKLDLKAIEKEAKVFDVWERGFINLNGKEFEIGVKERFQEMEIQNLLQDLLLFIEEATKVEEKTTIDLLTFTQPYITTLAVKHFTDMDMPDDIYETIAVTKNMINLGVLEKIIRLFPEDELTKLMERVKEALTSTTHAINQLADESDKIKAGKFKALEKQKANVREETMEKIKASNQLIDEALSKARTENLDVEDGKQ